MTDTYALLTMSYETYAHHSNMARATAKLYGVKIGACYLRKRGFGLNEALNILVYGK